MKIPFLSKKSKKGSVKVVKRKEVSVSKVKAAKKSTKIPKVIVYSTKTCPWCAKVKEFLRANKIPFTNKDVGSNKKNAAEMTKKSGQQGVPVVDVGGKIIVGFNESKLKSAIGI